MSVRAYLVEDSHILAVNLAEVLDSHAGVEVVGRAEDAMKASDWLLQHPEAWDLAIVDLVLGSGSGLSVLAACRIRRPHQRVVVFSNNGSAAMRTRCLAFGADGFFEKATELEALIDYCKAMA